MTIKKDNFKTKISITGSTGYIGSKLTAQLSQISGNVIAVSRSEQEAPKGVVNLVGDLNDLEFWGLITEHSDVVYHLAGPTSNLEAEQDPEKAMDDTITPILNLIKAAKKRKKKIKVVFASTATIYGNPRKLPCSEKLKPSPQTLYDLYKLHAENLLTESARYGDLNSITLRLSNVYGPSHVRSKAGDRGVVSKVIEQALKTREITIYGSGKYLRDYVYIDDVVSAFIKAGLSDASNRSPKIFNVGTGVSITVEDAFEIIADKVTAELGKDVHLRYVQLPPDFREINCRSYQADISKFRTLYNWNPETQFQDGISKTIRNILQRIGNPAMLPLVDPPQLR